MVGKGCYRYDINGKVKWMYYDHVYLVDEFETGHGEAVEVTVWDYYIK